MKLPEGMLELNAPLTAEEKEQQQRNKHVILSVATASRSEAVAESKDPYRATDAGYRGASTLAAQRGSVAQHDRVSGIPR